MKANKLESRFRAALIAGIFAALLPACGSEPVDDPQANSNEAQLGRFVAPELAEPADDATLTDQKPRFSWHVAPCQNQVIVQLCSDPACATVQQSFTSDSCTGIQLEQNLAPGAYYWRAARTDNQRWLSSWSAIRHFLIANSQPMISADLFGVFSVSKSNVWAVGAGGTILHYDDTWHIETSPTSQDLRAVWATAGGQAWAVGTAGTILRRDGSHWIAAESPTTEDLFGVWASAIDDAWAVGNTGLILHWNGSSWTVSHNRMAGVLKGVWGRAANDVWVVGSGKEPDGDYAALTLHWDGSSWLESYLCNPDGTHSSSGGWLASLSDVWGVRDGGLWAAGQCQSGASQIPYGYVAQNSGAGWGDTPGFGFGQPLGKYRPLRTIWSSSDSDVWAASASQTVNGADTTPNMLHWDGTSWTASPQAITTGISDLGGTAASDIWAVGLGGKRLHYDGTTWTATP